MQANEGTQVLIPAELFQRVILEASALSISPEIHVQQVLESAIAPAENFEEGKAVARLTQLTEFLRRIPSVTALSHSSSVEPKWWIKIKIDTASPVAWHVVQGLGYVLNYLSLEQPLPTVFYPVSPPPYLNGGPTDYLSWIIQAQVPFLDAGVITSFLKQCLPHPVEDEAAWLSVDDPDDEEDEV